MAVTAGIASFERFPFLKNTAVRTGLYDGAALSCVFVAWILIANRASFFERMATERNVAVAFLIFFFCLPILRFYRSPGELLVSGLLAWGTLSVTYWLLSLAFVWPEENDSAIHVFLLGALSYLIPATLSWIGTIIWRVRATDMSRARHQRANQR